MIRARFLGTGFAVPDRVVTNDDLSRLMDTSDEWIRTRTGIQERRWVREGETGADLAHAASVRALEAAGLQPGDIDLIVYATSTPDHFAPGNGVYLQRLLGLGPIPSIDIRNQCSGFVYALSVADAFIRCGQYRHVLVVGAEVQSTAMDVTTRGRNTAVLFADGAGAAVLGPAEDGRGILAFDLHGDGTQAEKLWVDTPGAMYHPRVSHPHRRLCTDVGQGGLPPCGGADARIRARGAGRDRSHPGRPEPPGGAPGEPPDRRNDAEDARPPGRSGLQQHHVVRQYDIGHHPDRLG